MVLHCVVPGDLAGVLEAQDLGKAKFRRHWTVGGFRILGLHGEAGVEARQEVPQHRRGLANSPGVSQAQFGDQSVLEGLRHAFHPALGLG